MGASGAGPQLTIDQIRSYYIFQRKIASVLNNEKNCPLFNIYKDKFKIQEAYVLSSRWIQEWKSLSNYEIAKESFDKIIANNEDDFINQMDLILNNLKGNIILGFEHPFYDNKNNYKRITRAKILYDELFHTIVDKKTYKLFDKIGNSWLFIT